MCIRDSTKIDRWFLSKLNRLVQMEKELAEETLDEETYLRAKRLGFLDKTIRRLSGQELPVIRHASYKMVDKMCIRDSTEVFPWY